MRLPDNDRMTRWAVCGSLCLFGAVCTRLATWGGTVGARAIFGLLVALAGWFLSLARQSRRLP